MKRNILSPLAAIAAFAFTLSGCASTDNQMGTTAMDTRNMTETQAVTATEPMGTNTDFQMQYEAETRSGGLVLTNDVSYRDMFADIENTKSYNILSLAETSSNLSTFVELLRTTGMMSLEAEGSYTLFAPTNEAFADLPAGRLEHLMRPENRVELVDMLNAHILPSKVRAGQFNSSQRISLDNDRAVLITVDQNNVNVGGANIVRQNIEASNGVIHVVDAVITPSENIGGPYGR